ncbi:SAM-dependent methyltransferase [Sphingobium scionense]|uniref:Putative TPR repeat methyltransferase n=1 Tax=Sphingobium scionense TaxID=1404341 RepID=A0A7W6PYA0_9SPHN|nr:SAM-dependent methyltransferase [Sphingobium scionense]MBB4151738.1 putative TPR repeat methyltransferase [Sphingobium scionense]
MKRHRTTLDPDYFERMFSGTSDPWDLESSSYEQAKFEDSIAALGSRNYASGFEVGCAKGMLTLKLSALCKALLSIDVSETALAAAKQRTAHLDHVTFEQMAFPRTAPSGQFELIVLSEVAYYWDDMDIGRAAEWLEAHLLVGGDLLLVHFTEDTDYPQSGDDAVAKLSGSLTNAMTVVTAYRRPRYRLDLWRRAL